MQLRKTITALFDSQIYHPLHSQRYLIQLPAGRNVLKLSNPFSICCSAAPHLMKFVDRCCLLFARLSPAISDYCNDISADDGTYLSRCICWSDTSFCWRTLVALTFLGSAICFYEISDTVGRVVFLDVYSEVGRSLSSRCLSPFCIFFL